MKRCVLIVLAAMLLLSGCGVSDRIIGSVGTDFLFYYLSDDETSFRSEYGMLVTERRTLTEEQQEPQAFLNLYFSGPVEVGSRLPFSSKMKLKEVVLEDGILSLTMSYEWNGMYQLDRKLAEICLLRTLMQLPDVKQVRINDLTLKESDYLLVDLAGQDDQIAVKLYYSDMSGRYLMKETRNKESGVSQSLHEFVLNELINGPSSEDNLPALPEGTRLMGVELTQGICTVNFSEEFLANRPKSHMQARVAVFAVVNSLMELSQVDGVRILCAGKEIKSYVGLDLSGVLYRDEFVMFNGGQNESYLDAILYLPVSDGKLVPVPVSVRQAVGRMGADALLSALLSYKTANGYINPFPEGTAVINQETADGLCTVTFNAVFAGNSVDQQQRQIAVRCLVATLCSLDYVDRVRILINDENSVLPDLGETLVPQDDWMLYLQ